MAPLEPPIALPIALKIPGGLNPNRGLFLEGTTLQNAKWFEVNLQCGPSLSERDDIAFRLIINLRRGRATYSTNSFINGKWHNQVGYELDEARIERVRKDWTADYTHRIHFDPNDENSQKNNNYFEGIKISKRGIVEFGKSLIKTDGEIKINDNTDKEENGLETLDEDEHETTNVKMDSNNNTNKSDQEIIFTEDENNVIGVIPLDKETENLYDNDIDYNEEKNDGLMSKKYFEEEIDNNVIKSTDSMLNIDSAILNTESETEELTIEPNFDAEQFDSKYALNDEKENELDNIYSETADSPLRLSISTEKLNNDTQNVTDSMMRLYNGSEDTEHSIMNLGNKNNEITDSKSKNDETDKKVPIVYSTDPTNVDKLFVTNLIAKLQRLKVKRDSIEEENQAETSHKDDSSQTEEGIDIWKEQSWESRASALEHRIDVKILKTNKQKDSTHDNNNSKDKEHDENHRKKSHESILKHKYDTLSNALKKESKLLAEAFKKRSRDQKASNESQNFTKKSTQEAEEESRRQSHEQEVFQAPQPSEYDEEVVQELGLTAGKDFRMVLICLDNGYVVTLNYQLFCAFPHRLDYSRVSHVCIDGHFDIDVLEVGGGVGPDRAMIMSLYPPMEWTDNVTVLTDESFAALVLGSAEPWLLNAYEAWCPACRRLHAQWEAVARHEEIKGIVKIGALDCDRNEQLAEELDVAYYPCIYYFHRGEKSFQSAEVYKGGRSAEFLINFVKWKLEGKEGVPPGIMPRKPEPCTLRKLKKKDILTKGYLGGGLGYEMKRNKRRKSRSHSWPRGSCCVQRVSAKTGLHCSTTAINTGRLDGQCAVL